MSDVVPPFDRQHFLTDLPDLLAGRESVFRTASAQRWAATREGKAHVRAMARVAATLVGSVREIDEAHPTPIPQRTRRAVERAAKHFPRRFAEAVRDLFIADHVEVIEAAGHACFSTEFVDAPKPRTQLVEDCRRDRGLLERRTRDRHASEPLPMESHDFSEKATLSAVFGMLDVLDRYDPRDENEYARILLNVRVLQLDREESLRALIQRSSVLSTSENAALLLGTLRCDARRFTEAKECADYALLISSRPAVAAYNAHLYASLLGELVPMRRSLDTLRESLDVDVTMRRDLRRQLPADLALLESASPLVRDHFMRIVEVLGVTP